ncbi:hypothetical protein fugu_002785, partial [Takifugu bimaculatus]
TASTTAVVETTTTVGSGTTASPETTVVTSTPSVVTTTVKATGSTTQGTTTQPGQTTASKETTVSTKTTPGTQVTTGPVTASTTAVVETTTTVGSGTTASPETTVVTSTPSVVTTTVKATGINNAGTTTQPGQTTASKETTVSTKTTPGTQVTTGPETTLVTGPPIHPSTNPVVVNTTITAASTPTLKSTTGFTSIGPITKTLPGTTELSTTGLFSTTPAPTFFSTTSLLSTTQGKCVCSYNGTSFNPGDLVYNVTDTLGWCYVAYCNASCQVEVDSSPCATTLPPKTTPFTTASTVISPTTPTLDCVDVDPPRKNGESWNVNNCTTATCINGTVIEKPAVCPTVQPLICSNGRPANKIYDSSGCCFHYECQCVCNVWNDNHYLTFDGQSYDFKKNCSYYLVKEIITKYNLTVTVKYDCDEPNSSTCPRTLTVKYGSNKVVFSQLQTSLMVHVNDKRRYPAYSTSDLRLTGTDMVLELEIPEIKTEVIYTGSSFSIQLPFDLFGGNTEGQCGTCDNSKPNDCRAPNGQTEDCLDSADKWAETDCVTSVAPTTPKPPLYTTLTNPPCIPAICKLLVSSVFEPCHKHVSPDSYLQTCESAKCNSANDTCSSLAAYAVACAEAGVCINWRNETNGQCEHLCPSDKVYMACGSTVEPTCNERYNDKFNAGDKSTTSTKEGCFCSNGTTLFNPVYKTCVPHCDCVGPDGSPKQPGETWTDGCSQCECDSSSMMSQCQPIQCPTVPTPTCSEPGQQLVNKTDGCCTNQSCECNVNLCPAPVQCELGFQVNVTAGVCCQTYTCVPKGVCVYNMTEYQPGSNVITTDPSEPPLTQPPAISTATTNPLGTTQLSLATATAGGAVTQEPFILGPCQECYCSHDTDPSHQAEHH